MQEIFDVLYEKSLRNNIFSNLMEIVTAEENIKLAYRNLKKNSGSKTAGTDKRTIEYLADLSDEKCMSCKK